MEYTCIYACNSQALPSSRCRTRRRAPARWYCVSTPLTPPLPRCAQIPLSGANSIVGRAVVVHELQDDVGKGDHSEPGTQGKTSKTTGNAGACSSVPTCATPSADAQAPRRSPGLRRHWHEERGLIAERHAQQHWAEADAFAPMRPQEPTARVRDSPRMKVFLLRSPVSLPRLDAEVARSRGRRTTTTVASRSARKRGAMRDSTRWGPDP